MGAQLREVRFLFAALLLLAGCGSEFQFGQVDGKLLVNGVPVEKIQVEFFPTKSGPPSIGITDAAGKFSLSTNEGKAGAVVGAHKVVLRDVGIMGDKFLGRAGEDVDMSQGRSPRILEIYSEVTKTPLQKEVTSGKCVIELDAKGPTNASSGAAK